MSFPVRLWLGAVIGMLAAATFRPGWAQDAAPPDRAGRVSVIEGRMTVKGSTNVEWTEAAPNYPVSAGMSFANAPGGRAELQLGGTTLRLDGRTAITILALSDTATIVQLEDGSVNVHTNVLFDNERIVIDAPNGHFSVMQAGTFRVDSDPTRVVAFQGRGELETQRGREAVRAGDSVEANAAGLVRHRPPEPTALDDWANTRERMLASSASQQYAGAAMPGVEDLDRNGTWQDSSDYGLVWTPDTVPATWEPYADGTWIWVDPWGWTWMDAQPWGFAPFHYGRWVSVRGRWAWSPGERVTRPIYAPALVGFIGSDPSRFRSRTVRPDHWVPLAPGEVYRPPYSRDAAYIKRVNRADVHGDATATAQSAHEDYANAHHFRDRAIDHADAVAAGRDARPPIAINDRSRNAGAFQNRERPAGGPGTGMPQYQPRQPSQIQPPNAPTPAATAPAPSAAPASGTNNAFHDPIAARSDQSQTRTPTRFGGPRPYQTGPAADTGEGNVGQGTTGQGNLGQGNLGQGNLGQGNTGQGPGPMPGQRQRP